MNEEPQKILQESSDLNLNRFFFLILVSLYLTFGGREHGDQEAQVSPQQRDRETEQVLPAQVLQLRRHRRRQDVERQGQHGHAQAEEGDVAHGGAELGRRAQTVGGVPREVAAVGITDGGRAEDKNAWW